jgi:dienelactone hydrolase
MYYTSAEYFEKRFDCISRQMGFKAASLEEFAVWRNALTGELKKLTGLDTGESAGLNAEVVEQVHIDGFRREKVLLETEPGVIMPLYVLVPGDLKKGERRPAVLALHGHWASGKLAVAGRTDLPEALEAIRVYQCDYGLQLVKQGFVVFCPDARGFGERREKHLQDAHGNWDQSLPCHSLNTIAVSLGRTMAGMMAWDNMRLIDYIQTRDECDGNRIGCAGLSGGGQQTMWLAAFDLRIKCAVISGYFYGCKSSLLRMPFHCACNYIPHLWEKADMGDICALIAPRPFLIETGKNDPLNGGEGLLNVYPQVEITRKAYELLNCTEKLYHDIFEGGHVWNGEKAIAWLKRWLMDNEAGV